MDAQMELPFSEMRKDKGCEYQGIYVTWKQV